MIVRKPAFIVLALAVLLVGCGQKSTIKNAVKAEKLSSAYGDGKHIIRNLTFPLTGSNLAYRTPLPGVGPIAGGILKFVGDIFAANTDMGKLQMSYTQLIPEIPNELNSVRLKRFFFYMKPQEKQRRFRDWFSRVFMGKGHVTFDFLDKLAVKMETLELESPETYNPVLLIKNYNRLEMASLMKIFTPYYKPEVVDPERAKDIVLLRYNEYQKSSDTMSDRYGQIHIMETERPIKTKHFLMDHPKMRGYFKRILVLDDSLLVELEKDPVVEEGFKIVLSDAAEQIEELGVTYIDTCTPKSCLELRVPDVNLIPIARKGNALKLDAVIHAGKVPESFKLKGFVEFEVKVDSPI